MAGIAWESFWTVAFSCLVHGTRVMFFTPTYPMNRQPVASMTLRTHGDMMSRSLGITLRLILLFLASTSRSFRVVIVVMKPKDRIMPNSIGSRQKEILILRSFREKSRGVLEIRYLFIR